MARPIGLNFLNVKIGRPHRAKIFVEVSGFAAGWSRALEGWPAGSLLAFRLLPGGFGLEGPAGAGCASGKSLCWTRGAFFILLPGCASFWARGWTRSGRPTGPVIRSVKAAASWPGGAKGGRIAGSCPRRTVTLLVGKAPNRIGGGGPAGGGAESLFAGPRRTGGLAATLGKLTCAAAGALRAKDLFRTIVAEAGSVRWGRGERLIGQARTAAGLGKNRRQTAGIGGIAAAEFL